MKTLFDAASLTEVNQRLATLTPASVRQWGTMSVAQAVAHCSAGIAVTLGESLPPRAFIGVMIGWAIKPLALGNDAPFRRNTPTMKDLVVADQRTLAPEVQRLRESIDRFVKAGPTGCTTHPHSFFGRLTPQEWGILTYKHLDHHLRQFGA